MNRSGGEMVRVLDSSVVEYKLNFNNNDVVRFVLEQQAELDFYSASSPKQQSAGRHIGPLKHFILIPSQPVFALSPFDF
jgi:hypothetical protein